MRPTSTFFTARGSSGTTLVLGALLLLALGCDAKWAAPTGVAKGVKVRGHANEPTHTNNCHHARPGVPMVGGFACGPFVQHHFAQQLSFSSPSTVHDTVFLDRPLRCGGVAGFTRPARMVWCGLVR
jgi:hypothetical protein